MNNNSIFEAFKHIDDTLINIDGIPNKKEIQLNKLNEICKSNGKNINNYYIANINLFSNEPRIAIAR